MLERPLSDDSWEAAENAAGQSQTNPFATEATTNNLQSQINALAPTYLISGGVSYSGTGFTYDISALSYRIQGTLYGTAATQVTLGAADPTFDRIDVIYVDNTGTVGVLAGTPSASPVKPQVTNTQLELTFVTVGAGATAPSITIEDIYLEDAGTPTEWATSATGFSPNFAATTDPHTGTYHIDTNGSFGAGDQMIFTPAAPYVLNGGNVNFWISPQASMSGPGTAFAVGFFVGGLLVGNYVQIGGAPFITYGFNPLGPLNVYQLVSIPVTAFGSLPANVDDIRLYKLAGPPANTDMYVDDFQIQEGVPGAGGSVDAAAVTYTPATPGNWSSLPANVAEALDSLAASGGGFTAASVAEINTGTDNTKGVTPLGLTGSKYLDQSGSKVSATAAGTNTYTATITPAITAYTATQHFFIKFTNANTGTATLNLNGLGAKPILKNSTVPLTIGDINAGQILCLAYDGTNFQIIGRVGTDRSIYRQGIDGAFIPGYAGTAGTYAYTGGLSTSVHLGSGANQQATRTYHFRLPDNFVAFKDIKVGTYRFGNVDSFTVRLVKSPTYPYASGTAGTVDSTINGLNVNPTANDTLEERTFVPGGSYAAGDTVAVMFDDQVDNGEYAEISFIDLNYYSK